MAGREGFIPPHGNYRALLSYQKAEIAYDITVRFCRRFLDRRDRTVDQMVQAARSGKQNIVEGCHASGTSKEMEIKLLGVARASLEELLADYEDFLRSRDLPLWRKDSPKAVFARRLGLGKEGARGGAATFETYREFVDTRDPEVVANIAVCVIRQASYLLDQQKRRLEQDFLEQGGIRERMTRARVRSRSGAPPG